MKYPLAAAAIAAALLGLAASSGEHRLGALIGTAIAGLTGLGSIFAIGLTTRAAKPMQAALAVMVVGFLVRLLLLAAGTFAVVRTSASVIAFVVAFFVSFFVFVALEAAYVHTLRRPRETSA